ncbi:MAG: polyprenyl synthetase family protein [Defluviitaleaceae bacterium]|nr:polyprenyl synthetase family protein [Defluviitaleaceae bacterium]
MTLIADAIKQVDKSIEQALGRSPKQIAPLAGHLLDSRGQGVRAKLLLTAASNNEQIHDHAIKAASAIEIFHLATLVHDDVIDDSPIRRGLPSVQSKFGKKHAVICGDYLFGLSLSMVADIYQPYTEFGEKFVKNIRLICLGELQQLSNANNLDLPFFDYLRIINGKTAVLFHVATFGGAIISKYHGNLNERQAKQIGRLGTYFGIIFQILDDCKDYTLDTKTAKKPTNTDIANGVVNLPLIMAMSKDMRLGDKVRAAMATREYGDIVKEVSLLGLTPTMDIAYRYAAKCRVILQEIPHLMAKEFEQLLNTQFSLASKNTEQHVTK